MKDRRERKSVLETQVYYDGDADIVYRTVYGENIHMGMFEAEGESLQSAMQRSNERIAEGAGFAQGHRVLDAGCGYGAMARFLARRYGCRVTATNISRRELERARVLTAEEGLAELVGFEWADYHDLPYEDASFDRWISQEAMLHAEDKGRVLGEAMRVLKPGGRLVLTDIVMRRETDEVTRRRIYDRIHTQSMWDAPDYRDALSALGLRILASEDWSRWVMPTYRHVRDEVERRSDEIGQAAGREFVTRTIDALGVWVDAASRGTIGWAYFVAEKPA